MHIDYDFKEKYIINIRYCVLDEFIFIFYIMNIEN